MLVTITLRNQGEQEYVISDALGKIQLRDKLESDPTIAAEFDHAIVKYNDYTTSTVDKGDVTVEGSVKECWTLDALITELGATGV